MKCEKKRKILKIALPYPSFVGISVERGTQKGTEVTLL